MPRINIDVPANIEKYFEKFITELANNKVAEVEPTVRHEFPGRERFLRKGFLRRQMWKQHTLAIMKNFEQIKENRDAVRERLRNQRIAKSGE